MEHIRKAVERAKDDRIPSHLGAQQSQHNQNRTASAAPPPPSREVTLNSAYLESKRIVAHDIADSRSKSFDMLRTQILQSMDMKGWQFLGVTSATEGCGKSVVATNLALSVARQPERSVLLVDLDLQKPRVANYLGVNCNRGIVSVLTGRTSLQDAVVQAHIKDEQLLFLPCEAPTANSSAWIASREMSVLLQEIKREFWNWTVIFDLPPILAGDDVISILPQLDCVTFVVGAGTTTAEQIKECNKHLESAEIVRVVLNKSEDATTTYYYSYPRQANGQGKERKSPKKRVKTPRLNRISRLLKRLSEP